jgi:hypothetical protein
MILKNKIIHPFIYKNIISLIKGLNLNILLLEIPRILKYISEITKIIMLMAVLKYLFLILKVNKKLKDLNLKKNIHLTIIFPLIKTQ